jgi:amino acid adenylation domain-containing protein
MKDHSTPRTNVSAEQEAIRAKCFHPSGTFVEFMKDEIEQSIPERFEKMVRLYPDRIAVKAEDRSLTYDELNQAANRIAHALLVQRGKQEEPIGLVLDHGVEAVTAILGVLKAGKMYVPLDPSFPTSRNRDVLEDSEPGLIVTDNKNFPLAVELASKKLALINIDEFRRSYPVENTDLRTAPDTLAYILYTSGSTGKPKGVVQNHRNVLHLIMRHTNRAHISPDDRTAVLRSFSVHGGTLQTFGGLLNGAAILPFDIKREGVQELAHWLAREEVTLCRMGPTLFRHLAEVLGEKDHFPKLREISFSGEPLHKNDVELWRQHFSDECILVNSFGATEVSSCCEYLVDKKTHIEDGVVPCGYPTGDMEIVLLQDDGRETRFGEIGEIAVKSRYLALEYWRKPELTRAKFLPGPKRGDERIHFTGDLGRMLPDGLLVHLWRKDFQVKIRGYRVELAEVESTLLTLDNIKEAVVVGREDQALEKRLVAYVVPDRMPAPSTTTLRCALREKLPDYMVPAAFVVLDAMPLTPNGKVDRNALSAPTGSRPDLDTPYAPPRSLIEEGLAGIWAEVLGLDHVGIHDSFLDLGGHSLAATRVTSRIYADYQVDLPLTQLFKTPTIAALTDYIERLHPSHCKVKHSPIRPVSREENLTLSFSQQRLWFLSQLEPDNPVYNEPKALRIRGSLDIDNLKKALDAIVARHEVLHTIFSSIDGNPVAALNENRSVALPLIDLSERPTVHREAEVRHLLREVTHRPFNLGRDLMLRAALFRMDKEDHVLLLVVHHIASDGWSSTIFFREISALYCAFITGSPSPLPNLPIQYADFAAWQRHWLQGEVLESLLFYWKKQLEGAPAVLNLPTDRPRPIIQSFRGARQSIELSKELTQGLKALSQEEEATLFMTLLAGFLTLLHRYTGQADMLVGSPVANRTRLELEGLIGCFVNTLVLRVNVRDDPSFLELLRRVRDVCLEAYSHQDLAFEKIVEELQPQRDLSRSPLVQVMFQMRNVPKRVLRLPATEIKEMEFDHGIAKFDLALAMADAGENLTGSLEYNTDLFNDTTIERMLGNYQTLLESMVARPEQRLSEATILTADEKHQLLTRWNDTKREYPKDKCIHELFETQVEKSPDAVAVVYEDQQLTYRELNRRANQLAHYLKKLDVGPEVLVAICMARSLEMIVGLLGILKAGGAYVPLDPEYPKDRLALMLEDSRALTIVTEQRFADRFPQRQAILICLDDESANIRQESIENPVTNVTPESLAYVIYTSGSTGNPKGVMIEHRSFVNYLYWFNQAGLADKLAVLPVVTKPTFDASLKQLFAPLLRAGQVWILSDEVISEPPVLLKTLSTRSGTVLNCFPGLWNALLELIESNQTLLSSEALSVLLLGGEQVNASLTERTLAVFPHVDIWNLYGPTEATANAIAGKITPERPTGLGRPTANATIALLDANLEAVPIGVTGELYIGGVGLARGYLGRADLTAEKFIPNPFSQEPGARLYKTGDLAHYRADGDIEFVGRSDNQVKIRGFRIELGEIEAILAQYPSVRESLVAAQEIGPGERRLVAYVVRSHGPATTAHELRAFLKEKLPEYMVPSAFVILDTLPLTPNGKVDRKALPVPDQSRPELDQIFVVPRTPVEEMIAEIWAEALKVERVGIHDNFFDLGGHSLLATQVISRMRQTFHVDLSLRLLFERPTVAGLAVQIAQAQAKKAVPEEITEMLGDLESLSDEEAEHLLGQENPKMI